MKIGFYAYDVGPAQALEEIADFAKRSGHETVVLPPQIRDVSAEQAENMYGCDVALIGLSSFQTQEELILALLLARKKIPVVIIEDTPGAACREKAKSQEFDLPKITAAVIVAHDSSIKTAEDFGYKNVHYLGPPPHWGVSFKKLMAAKASGIRRKLKKQHGAKLLKIAPADKIIFVPGTKDPALDTVVLTVVTEEAKKIIPPGNFVLGFKKHPGEKPESPEEKPLFTRSHETRSNILKDEWTVDIKNYSLSELLPAADILISYTAATESIVAAYARLNVAYFYNEKVRYYLRRLGIKSGEWFVAELGGAYKIEDTEHIAGAIKALISPAGQKALRKEQEKHFPLPKTWNTAPKYLEFLKNII